MTDGSRALSWLLLDDDLEGRDLDDDLDERDVLDARDVEDDDDFRLEDDFALRSLRWLRSLRSLRWLRSLRSLRWLLSLRSLRWLRWLETLCGDDARLCRRGVDGGERAGERSSPSASARHASVSEGAIIIKRVAAMRDALTCTDAIS